jgi:hypothetical protein
MVAPLQLGEAPAKLDAVELRLHLPQRPFALLVVVASVAAVGVIWAQVVITFRDARPVPTTARASAIVWAGKVFDSPATISSWLSSRGASYHSWSRMHPGARAVLEKLPPPQTPPAASATPSRPGVATTTPAPQNAARTVTKRTHSLGGLFVLVSLIAGAVCVLAALLPAAIRGRWFPAMTFAAARYRLVLVGAGAAILLGLVVGATQA